MPLGVEGGRDGREKGEGRQGDSEEFGGCAVVNNASLGEFVARVLWMGQEGVKMMYCLELLL